MSTDALSGNCAGLVDMYVCLDDFGDDDEIVVACEDKVMW